MSHWWSNVGEMKSKVSLIVDLSVRVKWLSEAVKGKWLHVTEVSLLYLMITFHIQVNIPISTQWMSQSCHINSDASTLNFRTSDLERPSAYNVCVSAACRLWKPLTNVTRCHLDQVGSHSEPTAASSHPGTFKINVSCYQSSRGSAITEPRAIPCNSGQYQHNLMFCQWDFHLIWADGCKIAKLNIWR